MTQIDFYLLDANSKNDRLEFACRLAETIFRRGFPLFINCASQQQAQELSDKLWSFKPESFLPHQLITQTEDANAQPLTEDKLAAITLGWPDAEKQNQPAAQEVLVNLSLDVPDYFSAYSRVTEIMDSDEQVLEAKREAWQFYKDRGYRLRLHRIT